MVFKRIFGEHCSRCGETRTKEKFEGIPTCEKCEVQIEADREEVRPCPVCTTTMEKTIVKKIIVDRCPSCRGAWLDAGELELLKEAVENNGGDFATGMVIGMAVG